MITEAERRQTIREQIGRVAATMTDEERMEWLRATVTAQDAGDLYIAEFARALAATKKV